LSFLDSNDSSKRALIKPPLMGPQVDPNTLPCSSLITGAPTEPCEGNRRMASEADWCGIRELCSVERRTIHPCSGRGTADTEVPQRAFLLGISQLQAHWWLASSKPSRRTCCKKLSASSKISFGLSLFSRIENGRFQKISLSLLSGAARPKHSNRAFHHTSFRLIY